MPVAQDEPVLEMVGEAQGEGDLVLATEEVIVVVTEVVTEVALRPQRDLGKSGATLAAVGGSPPGHRGTMTTAPLAPAEPLAPPYPTPGS